MACESATMLSGGSPIWTTTADSFFPSWTLPPMPADLYDAERDRYVAESLGRALAQRAVRPQHEHNRKVHSGAHDRRRGNVGGPPVAKKAARKGSRWLK